MNWIDAVNLWFKKNPFLGAPTESRRITDAFAKKAYKPNSYPRRSLNKSVSVFRYGKYVETFASMSEAGRKYGVSVVSVSASAKGKRVIKLEKQGVHFKFKGNAMDQP